MFRLQWIDGSSNFEAILNDWIKVENHPFYAVAEVCKRMPFGWLVV